MYRLEAELWLWDGAAAWHPHPAGDVRDDVRARAGTPRGFGSVRVQVTVGETVWKTSVFPDSKRGAYLLPVKKDVRRREGLDFGDRVTVQLELSRDAAGRASPRCRRACTASASASRRR